MAPCRLIKPVGIFVALLALVLSSSVALSEPAQFDEVELFVETYDVADLPVWRSNGETKAEFDPTVLIFYIKKSVDSKGWKHGAELRGYGKDSLLVVQTAENQKQVVAILERFRESE